MRTRRLQYLFPGVFLMVSSCAVGTANIPTIHDLPVEHFVGQEAAAMLSLTDKAQEALLFKFHLTDKTLGASAGDRQIYVNYALAKRAMDDARHRWMLRLILAHEIAHDVAGHRVNKQALASVLSGASMVGQAISYAPGVIGLAGSLGALALGLMTRGGYELYSRSAELEADRMGIEYWKRLGWDCKVWPRFFLALLGRGHTGDFHHPTKERFNQSLELCLPEGHPERVKLEEDLKLLDPPEPPEY